MNMDYTREYLSLIEEVAEDCELTHREIYRLAKWLNDNKKGRQTWPANQFLPLLKDVFADGKIERSEAQKVGRLIQKVRREWAREHTLSGTKRVKIPIATSIGNFDDGQPRLPLFATKLTTASFTEPDVVYEVDFSGPYCSCPDFRSSRQHLPVGHISRCCKHIMQGYSEIRPPNGWPSWLDPFLEAGFRPDPNQEWTVYKSAVCNFLVSSASREWGNVYGRISDDGVKYGYNVNEERWAYGKKPNEAYVLAEIVHKLSEL